MTESTKHLGKLRRDMVFTRSPGCHPGLLKRNHAALGGEDASIEVRVQPQSPTEACWEEHRCDQKIRPQSCLGPKGPA